MIMYDDFINLSGGLKVLFTILTAGFTWFLGVYLKVVNFNRDKKSYALDTANVEMDLFTKLEVIKKTIESDFLAKIERLKMNNEEYEGLLAKKNMYIAFLSDFIEELRHMYPELNIKQPPGFKEWQDGSTNN
jgi:hypothetical protein